MGQVGGEGLRRGEQVEHAAADAAPTAGPLHLGEEVADGRLAELLVAGLDESRAKPGLHLVLLDAGGGRGVWGERYEVAAVGVEGPPETGEVFEEEAEREEVGTVQGAQERVRLPRPQEGKETVGASPIGVDVFEKAPAERLRTRGELRAKPVCRGRGHKGGAVP